jgi:hypothetical protein
MRITSSARLCWNGLVGVVGVAVGEEVVDDHADDGEEEDDECPEHLVRDGAVGLEDLDCSTCELWNEM